MEHLGSEISMVRAWREWLDVKLEREVGPDEEGSCICAKEIGHCPKDSGELLGL